MPDAAKQILNREIFSGPYGRYTTNAAWSPKDLPTMTQVMDNITSITVHSYDDIDTFQVFYGGQAGPLFGSSKGGEEAKANLAFDEYIRSIDVMYGQKISQLTFHSNKDKAYGPYGKGEHGKNQTTVLHDGFRLTSMQATRCESFKPPGCEGIIFGFRPTLFI